jgi:pimeloyl-ACP methyl ester carboxylesterase
MMARFTTSDGLSLHFEDTGTGLPLLCLPGLTRTTRDFDYVAPHLAGCRLIRMDYRGRGQSDPDDDWQRYSLPIEGRDVIELLDHLGLDRVAILGTSRGGLIAMGLAALVPDRLMGVALNDVGPVIDPAGLEVIAQYIGRNPAARTHADAAAALKQVMVGFEDVPDSRWLHEARIHFADVGGALQITYDPRLRDAVLAAGATEMPDLWPFFDALAGKPLACLRGVNSNLLSPATLAEMQRRRPDMITAEIPGRGHVPFLDEPQAVAALHRWLELMP